MFLTGIVDMTTEMPSGDGVPWKADTQLVLELWSAVPLHLDGATFVVIQRGARKDMTAELVKIERPRILSRDVRGKQKSCTGGSVSAHRGMAGKVDHVAAPNPAQESGLGCFFAGEQAGAPVEMSDLAGLAIPVTDECAESRESDRQSNAHDDSPFDNECGSSPPMQMKAAQLAG